VYKKFLVAIIVFFVVGVFFCSVSSADEPANNLKKATANIFGGWTEIATYPAQEAVKSGLLEKIMFPVNICLGAVKGAPQEVVGAVDLVTFFKEKNIINSWPGEEELL